MLKRYTFILFFVLLVFPISANAACSSERLSELTNIADNVTLNYTYKITNGDAIFRISATNLTKDIYLYDEEDGVTASGTGTLEVNKDFSSGKTLSFVIYSNDNNCKNEALTTKYIELPHYNVYSEYSMCESYPEHKYCQRWYDSSNLSREDFDAALAEYSVRDLNLNDDEGETKKEKTRINKIMNFISDNKVVIGVTALVIVMLIIIIVRRKIKKRSL
jgi:hypothetical protein